MSTLAHTPGELSPDKQALLALRKMRARLDDLERARTEPMAIVGLACRFPRASTPEEYWRLLRDGVDAVSEVPADRWDIDAFYDPHPDAAGKMYTRHGAFLDRVDLFDAQHFSISRREATMMDPQQRLLLELTWEALERAGYAPDRLIGSETGVFVGISISDYGQLLLRAPERESDGNYLGTGNLLSAAAGRLSYALGLQGPSLSIDTACSSSLVAVHLACQALRDRDCQLAVAGGVNVMLNPVVTANCCRGRMLAADGRCKTFDEAADGYVRGEGCGVVVLKRLSDAVAAGDRILALIRGSAVNQDGRSSGFTAPNELAQLAVIRKALKAAQVDPADVGYLEAHGTGTSLGDPIELHAVAAAYGDGRPADRPLIVGSVKTNIGHLESAAGVAGLIKIVLLLQHEEIPPHLHFRSLNPHISVDGFPFVIPRERMPWRAGERRRLAALSSFGFTGTNSHVIVEEAPPEPTRSTGPDRSTHILALSARGEAGVNELVDRWTAHLQTASGSFADACFTANAARAHFDHRLAVIAGTAEEAGEALQEISVAGTSSRVRRGRARKGLPADVVFLFTGQGSQSPGMARTLYDTQSTFRRTLDRCDDILRPELERPLLSVLYPAHGGPSPLNETAYTQPALFAIEYALAELWRSWGIEPTVVIGHSIGELVAACVAGVFSLEDGLKLVAARGRLMQALPRDGGMAAVFANAARVRSDLNGCSGVSIAAINDPENTVISGPRSGLDAALEAFERAGTRTQPLAVSHAFHSSLMDPMLDEFARVAARIPRAAARVSFVSNLTGDFVDPSFTFGADHWRAHVRETVRFADGIAAIHARGHRVFLEIGPSPTLLAMGRRTLGEDETAWLPSLRRGRDDWDQLLETVADLYVGGAAIDWTGFDRDYARRKVEAPGYPFQRQRFWATIPAPTPASRSQPADAAAMPLAGDLYAIEWTVAEMPAVTPDAALPTSSFAVVADIGPFADALKSAFERDGSSCVLETTAGDDTDPQRYHRLVASLKAGNGACDGIVLVADVERSPDDPLGAEQLDLAHAASGRLISIVQALARSGGAWKMPRIWVVTTGAQPAGRASTLNVTQAPAWGLGRIVALEHPELWGGLVDLDPVAAADRAATVVRHVKTTGVEDQVAYRGGCAYVPRLRNATPNLSAADPLSPNATYAITGGLGSLGLAIAARFVARGARHLVLVGRRGLPDRDQWPHVAVDSDLGRPIAAIQRLEAAGARVRVVSANIGKKADVDALFASLRHDGPPVRGIVHVAGVAHVAPVDELTPEILDHLFEAKVAGGWWLHEATRDLALDFFVLFSSISSAWGSKGLAGYAAANHFLDALAHHRRALGLPALSINWGPWAQGGMLDAQGSTWLASMGVAALQPSDALDALDRLAGIPAAQIVVARVDWRTFLPVIEARGRRPFLQALAGATVAGEAASDGRAGRETHARLAALGAADRLVEISRLVREEVAAVLGTSHPGQIADDDGMFEMGMDSLMAVQLRRRLETAFDRACPPTLTFDYPNVGALAEYFNQQLFARDGRDAAVSALVAPVHDTGGDLEAAIGAVESLSDGEVESLLATYDAAGAAR